MADVCVVNASPLIFLSRAGHLDLLTRFYGQVLVPAPVMQEILARGGKDPTVMAIRATSRIEEIKAVDVPQLITAWGLGVGESSVLAAALTSAGVHVIIDDMLGRRCASALGIPVRGTLGIVLLAKQAGMIPAARAVIEDLLQSGMYLDHRTIDDALRRVQE